MILSAATYNCFIEALDRILCSFTVEIIPLDMLGEHSKLVSYTTPVYDFQAFSRFLLNILSAFLLTLNYGVLEPRLLWMQSAITSSIVFLARRVLNSFRSANLLNCSEA